MPNSNSAKKRLRQNETRRQINRTIKSSLRTQLRKVRDAITAGDVETTEVAFRAAVKKLDRAAAKKIIHPNAAARAKSRLSTRVKALTT
ncbi:MAG: 30S ribosomal protein S20 [Pirellulales bacterium]|nr:30S ribosomal protein S20 [Pirellulales bacterium]